MNIKILTAVTFLWINLSIFSIVAWSGVTEGTGKRDPFVPLISEEKKVIAGLVGIETLDDLNVEGIVPDAAGSIAIVNGEIVRAGEVYDNLKILKIQSNGVLFEINEIEQFKPFGNDETS
jgi:hypothetical protein